MSGIEWGYDVNNGPETWMKLYPQAAGSHQSPVNICTKETVSTHQNNNVEPFSFKYSHDSCQKLTNTGHGWKVDYCGAGCELKGGPLKCKFTLVQFHCHWGPNDSNGSEHMVDGKSYAGELHLVHYNSDKYKSFLEAAQHSDGLAVLGIFFKIGKGNSELTKITALLPRVLYKNDTVNLNNLVSIDVNKFLPHKLDYWTYHGSLTTPPCNEVVSWIVFKEPINISPEQLEVFRRLRVVSRDEKNISNIKLTNNVRPVNALGERVICDCKHQ